MPRPAQWEPGWPSLLALVVATFLAGMAVAVVLAPDRPSAPPRPVVYVNPSVMPVMEFVPCAPDARIYARRTTPPSVVEADTCR